MPDDDQKEEEGVPIEIKVVGNSMDMSPFDVWATQQANKIAHEGAAAIRDAVRSGDPEAARRAATDLLAAIHEALHEARTKRS